MRWRKSGMLRWQLIQHTPVLSSVEKSLISYQQLCTDITSVERMEFDLDAASGTQTLLNGCITYILTED